MSRGRKLNKHEGLRIAMVAACPFPSLRGSQVLIRNVAEGLAKRGHRVHVLTHSSPDDRRALCGLHVHRARSRFSAPRIASWCRLPLDLKLMLELFKVVRARQIDVIHAHNYEGQLVSYPVGWITGVPVVYHAHNVLADELPWYVRAGVMRAVARCLGALLDRYLPRLADHTIALTKGQTSSLTRSGVRADRITQVDPCVDLASRRDKLPSIAPDQFDGKFVVMYAGNLDGYQNLRVLLEGFQQFAAAASDAVLVLVVHTREPKVELELERSGAVVVVAPTFAATQPLLARADVLVCPRTAWSGFPIKLINYMRAGRAILCTDAVATVMPHAEPCLLFRADDAAALAEGLQRLYVNSDLRTRLGVEAQIQVRRYGDTAKACAGIEGVYARLAEQRRPRSTTIISMLKGLIGFRRERISAAVGEESAAA